MPWILESPSDKGCYMVRNRRGCGLSCFVGKQFGIAPNRESGLVIL
jgi:hypothetical protein